MPPRWITQEDWLRTAGAPEESSRVPPEQSHATAGVRPPSPQDELPSPQDELPSPQDELPSPQVEPPSPHEEPSSPQEEPSSPHEGPPSPQEKLRGPVEGTRKRFRIVTMALTFAGLGLILATMLYAFAVVDQRALQAFKAPLTVQPETATETVGDAAASPAVSDPMPATQQTATGQTRPDPMLNTQQNVRRNVHHGSRTHGKRFSR